MTSATALSPARQSQTTFSRSGLVAARIPDLFPGETISATPIPTGSSLR